MLTAGWGIHSLGARFPFFLSRTGVMVLSGVSKSCRNMAAEARRRYVPDAITHEGASNGGSAVA
jgi:hypothetical protein